MSLHRLFMSVGASMHEQHSAHTDAGSRIDLLHWLLFLLAICGAYVLGPPAAFAQSNTLAEQQDLHMVGPVEESETNSPGTIREAPADSGSQNAEEASPTETRPEDTRTWNEDESARDAYAAQLTGSWRINLTQFMTRQLAENGRPGLAMIAGALTQELFGESYGIVTANADGTGSARGVWFGETLEGTGSWEILAVDGEHARLRLQVPEYGVDRIFEVRREDDRVYAQYQQLPAVFVRQSESD